MKLNVCIDLFETSADVAGELLLLTVNTKERWGYTTSELEGDWKEVSSHADPEVLRILMGVYAEEEGNQTVTCIYSKELNIYGYLHWDGDGCLAFVFPNRTILYNSDMKKDYDWKWYDGWAST